MTKVFNNFCAEYDFEKHEQVWKNQSKEFRQFWHRKILDDNYPELSEADMDCVIKFFDRTFKGSKEFRENGGECVASANIRRRMWYKALQGLKNTQDIREIVHQIFMTENDNLKINLVNKLEKVNQKNKNCLTGKNAIILNALIFTYNPDKYLSVLSIDHRFVLMNFFGFGDSTQYDTYGEQVIKMNNDIILGFKEKYNIDVNPRALSWFIYNQLDKKWGKGPFNIF